MKKIILFGTGRLYERYKYALREFDIIGIVDNNDEKVGCILDGTTVSKPETLDYRKADYVVVLIKDCSEVVEQLKSFDIPYNKILTVQEFAEMASLGKTIYTQNRKQTMAQWISDHKGKKILILSHDFSRTGVPVVGMYTCMLLLKMGYEVLYGALGSGSLTEDLSIHGIDYVDYLEYLHDDGVQTEMLCFDAFLLCTIAVAKYARYIGDLGRPVLWWINESYTELFDVHTPIFKDNFYYFADGKMISDLFKQRYPDIQMENLYYYIPETKGERNITPYREYKCVRFVIIGTICKRKGSDILLESINMLSQEINNEAEYTFIGQDYDLDIDWGKICRNKKNIFRRKEVSQEKLMQIFKEMDVLICPSREDSDPVVVTQAFQNGMPCIVSSGVGQSIFMENDTGGYVFENMNIEDLSRKIEAMIINKERIPAMGKQARKIYENHFSENAHKAVLEKWLSEVGV